MMHSMKFVVQKLKISDLETSEGLLLLGTGLLAFLHCYDNDYTDDDGEPWLEWTLSFFLSLRFF